jgi:ABC-2 type transport system permease protein
MSSPAAIAIPAQGLSAWSLAVWTLLIREWRRFYRQRSRVVGALLQPLLFWIFIGAGMRGSFQSPTSPTLSYSDYVLPGMLLMILMFTGIFSTITIIEDRREGFLQGVLVAPVAPSALVTGKVLGGAMLGLSQALLMLLLLFTPWTQLHLTMPGLLQLLLWLLVLACLFTAAGVLMAWPMRSTQGYHALMSVLLLPLWLFSGAVFPAAGAPKWLAVLMWLNPLTHGLDLVHACFGQAPLAAPLWGSIIYVLVSTLVLWGLAIAVCARPREG